jgi:hypothetical protein
MKKSRLAGSQIHAGISYSMMKDTEKMLRTMMAIHPFDLTGFFGPS